MKEVLRVLCAIIGLIWAAAFIVSGVVGFGLVADYLVTPDDPTLGFLAFAVGLGAAAYAILCEEKI